MSEIGEKSMYYEVRALRIRDADSFPESYSYRHLCYVDAVGAEMLKNVVVPEIARWPQCHMTGWPVFQLFFVMPHECPEGLVRNNLAYLNDIGRESE
jgi:hypothetical protein